MTRYIKKINNSIIDREQQFLLKLQAEVAKLMLE